jgi:uncharacterized protein DUF5677
MAPSPEPQNEGKKLFASALDSLAAIGGFSNHVSVTLVGTPTDAQGDLASRVHAKMCAHALSIGALSKSNVFDHHAINSIARMILESMTMYFYLRENVTEEEWSFRDLILRLHDTTSRVKLLRAWKKKSEYDDLTTEKDNLIRQIESHSAFSCIDADRQKRLLTGEEMFVQGMRKVAKRSGWREEVFISVYNYFSAHAHSTPASFFRMPAHSVDYFNPSDFQYTTSAPAIEIAVACLRRVAVNYFDANCTVGNIVVKKFSKEFLERVRKEDADCKVFNSTEI